MMKAADPDSDEGAPNEGEVQNVMEDSALFEAGGVSLGREETFRIALAMKVCFSNRY
jgi:hypothetical protein